MAVEGDLAGHDRGQGGTDHDSHVTIGRLHHRQDADQGE
jgi:hypothetical protein